MDSRNDAVTRSLEGVRNLYSGNLSSHGASPQSVGWRDLDSQRLRFEKLAQVVEPRVAAAGFTVNDLGSGYGAMFPFLDALPGTRLTRYMGYDISEEMLSAAGETIPDERAVFLRSDRVTEVADYSLVSGTFNVKLDADDPTWTEYITETLYHLDEHSRHGFAFNLLTTYVDWKEDHLYYGDPHFFFDFCKRKISRFVSLLHDYPLYEWTILVKKVDGSG